MGGQFGSNSDGSERPRQRVSSFSFCFDWIAHAVWNRSAYTYVACGGVVATFVLDDKLILYKSMYM